MEVKQLWARTGLMGDRLGSSRAAGKGSDIDATTYVISYSSITEIKSVITKKLYAWALTGPSKTDFVKI